MLLLDLDGVIYKGPSALPYAVDSLRSARERGVGLGFLTNNASRSPEDVARHLSSLGIASTPHDVVTSAQAAATLLAATLEPGDVVLVIGSPALASAVADVGLRPVRRCVGGASGADGSPHPGVAAVVQGFAPDITYDDLSEATLAIRAGAWWVAANLDPTLPTERGLQPGNGALVAAVALATNARPDVAGKPGLALYEEAVRRTAARRPLVVGDRLDTDIAGACAAGMSSLLVLSGVTSVDDLTSAQPGLRPTYIAADLRALHTQQAGATGVDGVGRCGGAEARCDRLARIVRVSTVGQGAGFEWDDAARAAAVAAWSLPPHADGWRVEFGQARGHSSA